MASPSTGGVGVNTSALTESSRRSEKETRLQRREKRYHTPGYTLPGVGTAGIAGAAAAPGARCAAGSVVPRSSSGTTRWCRANVRRSSLTVARAVALFAGVAAGRSRPLAVAVVAEAPPMPRAAVPTVARGARRTCRSCWRCRRPRWRNGCAILRHRRQRPLPVKPARAWRLQHAHDDLPLEESP
jgi:hypothetical protein